MKRLLVLLTLSVLFAGSIFAFGPMNQQNWQNQQNQGQTAAQTPAQVGALAQQQQKQVQAREFKDNGLQGYFNLPADASISEVKTLDGTVVSISLESEKGLVVKFESAGVTYDLRVGPLMRELSLKAGDKITVTGRIVSTSTDKYVVVEKVKIGDKEYTATRGRVADAQNTTSTTNTQDTQSIQNMTRARDCR